MRSTSGQREWTEWRYALKSIVTRRKRPSWNEFFSIVGRWFCAANTMRSWAYMQPAEGCTSIWAENSSRTRRRRSSAFADRLSVCCKPFCNCPLTLNHFFSSFDKCCCLNFLLAHSSVYCLLRFFLYNGEHIVDSELQSSKVLPSKHSV